MKNYGIVNRLEELSLLQPGWFEGAGLALDKTRLSLFAEKIAADYPDELALPAIFPTQEGNLLLEWDAPCDPSLDIRLADFQASFHAFGKDGTDIERGFDLGNEADWKHLTAFLVEHIRKRVA